MGLNKLNRGIEITVKGMVEDEKYFEAALAVRKEMITQLHQHDVKLLEDIVYPQPTK